MRLLLLREVMGGRGECCCCVGSCGCMIFCFVVVTIGIP